MLLLLLEVVLPLLFLGLTTGKKSEVDPRTRFRLLVAARRESPSLGLVALHLVLGVLRPPVPPADLE